MTLLNEAVSEEDKIVLDSMSRQTDRLTDRQSQSNSDLDSDM
jgi:hypothetical protein